MNIQKLCLAVALLTDAIGLLDGQHSRVGSAFRAHGAATFGDLPKRYRDAFAALLADESKHVRVHRAATPKRLREELALWIEELVHCLVSPNDTALGRARSDRTQEPIVRNFIMKGGDPYATHG